jgi:hypothetical protein
LDCLASFAKNESQPESIRVPTRQFCLNAIWVDAISLSQFSGARDTGRWSRTRHASFINNEAVRESSSIHAQKFSVNATAQIARWRLIA